MTYRLLCCLAGLSLLLGGCFDETAVQTPVTPVKDAVSIQTIRGEAHVAPNPKKIASFDIGAVDTLTALGVKVAGVPGNVYLPYLKPAVKDSTAIGTLFEPDLEALYHMKPDLIIVAARSSPKYDEVRKIAPTIDMSFNGADQIASALRQLAFYGRLTGTQDKAKALSEAIQTQLEQTRKQAQNAGTALVLMVNGGKLSVFGPYTRFGWIHHEVGFGEVIKNTSTAPHGQPVSFEFVEKMNPDWLVVIDRSAAIGAESLSARQVLDNALVRQTTAWKKGQIIYLSNSSYIAPGGVTQIRRDLSRIQKALTEAAP